MTFQIFKEKTTLFNNFEEQCRWINKKHGLGQRAAIVGPQSALAEKLTYLEDGFKCLLFPSGMAAIAITLMSILNPSDHILVSEGVYSGTRDFLENFLQKKQIEITYYDPTIGDQIKSLIKKNTKVLFCESPSSWSFEVQDLAVLSDIAKKKNIITLCDNSWSTPLFFKPLKMGVDIVVSSLSKYISGHSDISMGYMIPANQTLYSQILQCSEYLGLEEGPSQFEQEIVQRSFKTLEIRLARIESTCYKVLEFLQHCSQIEKIFHPSLPHSRGHKLWKQHFKGSAGLFTIVFKNEIPLDKIEHLLNSFEHIKLGLSWGGDKSFIRSFDPRQIRQNQIFKDPSRTFRVSIGLEDHNLLLLDLNKIKLL